MAPIRLLTALLPLCLQAAPAAAQPQAGMPTVVVPYTRDPVDKSYRRMVRGMERYQREQARERLSAAAPQSTLRFQLLPRQPGVRVDGVRLEVKGDTFTLPVAMAPDHTFTLERNEQALREDAALVANRKSSSMTWRALVRSAGVPDGMRRLGDLRLECLVGMEAGLVSNNARLFAWLSDLLASPDRVCNAPDGNYLQFAERPLFGVTLRHGERVAVLPFRALYAGGTQTAESLPYCDCQVLLDRSYYAPTWDQSWPDDTLLGFEYMDDAPEGPPPVAGKQDARARLGAPTQVLRFDSGYAVWLYESPAARKVAQADGRPAMAELVLLFAPDGAAVKARRREP